MTFTFRKEKVNDITVCQISKNGKILFEIVGWNALSDANALEIEGLCSLLNEFYENYLHQLSVSKALRDVVKGLENADTIADLETQIIHLKDRNNELRNDLIDHSALMSMLEAKKGARIEEILWELYDFKSNEEFDHVLKEYLKKAKKCW